MEWGNGEVGTVGLEWVVRNSWYRPTAKGRPLSVSDLGSACTYRGNRLGLLEMLFGLLSFLPPWTREPRSIGKLVRENGADLQQSYGECS